MKRPLLLLLSVLMVLLSGCRSHRNVPSVAPPEPEVVAPTAPREYSVVNFTASVEGVRVNGQLRIAKDSLVWANATKVVELGRAMASPDSVWVNAPVMGISFAGTYADLQRQTRQQVTFEEIQQAVESDDAETGVAALARRMGVKMQIKITKRMRVDQLSFPFQK